MCHADLTLYGIAIGAFSLIAVYAYKNRKKPEIKT